MEYLWSMYGASMEYLRRKNRPKEKDNPLLSALKTKRLKVEIRGGLGGIKIPTPPRYSRRIDGSVGMKMLKCKFT